MSLRAAIARATDSAGRIHWTRSLAAAIDEADARLAAPSPARRWALARELEEALGVGDTMGDEQLDRAVEAVRALRERAEKAEHERDDLRREYLCAECQGLTRERDEARADAVSWLSQCEEAREDALRYGRERDEARAQLAALREACVAADAARTAEGQRSAWPAIGAIRAYRRAIADTATAAREHEARVRAGLARCALDLAAEIELPGHDGDEESGWHDEDCQRCAIDALLAMLADEAEKGGA